MVALTDPAVGNVSPGVLSPSSAGSFPKGKKGMLKSTSSKGKPSSTYKYTKSPAKGKDPRGRAKATLTCLRCGNLATLQQIVQFLPVPAKSGVKRPAIESIALAENAHVFFQDAQGYELPDVVMLDPGTSAFLSGFGPARRYLLYLESQGYSVDEVKFNRCRHIFHFGGDGELWSHWVVLNFQWILPHEPYDFMMGRGRLSQLDFMENISCPSGIQSSRSWTSDLWTLTCGLLLMGRWIHNASPSGSSALKKLPSLRWISRRLHWTLENKCSGLTSSKPLSNAFRRTTTITMAM